MASEKITALIEEVKGLTVLELSELVHALEDEFGVSAAAPAAVLPAVPPAALPPKRRKQGCLSIPGHRQTAPQAPIEPRS